MILLDNVNINVPDPAAIFESNGGPTVVTLRASDWGTATAEIQAATIEDVLSRWATLPGGTFAQIDGTVTIDYLPSGMKLRAILSGVGGGTDGVFVSILQ